MPFPKMGPENRGLSRRCPFRRCPPENGKLRRGAVEILLIFLPVIRSHGGRTQKIPAVDGTKAGLEGDEIMVVHHQPNDAGFDEHGKAELSASRTAIEPTENSHEKDGILGEHHQPNGEIEIVNPIPSRPLEPCIEVQRGCAREGGQAQARETHANKNFVWPKDTAKVTEDHEIVGEKVGIWSEKSADMIEYDQVTGRWSPVRMRR